MVSCQEEKDKGMFDFLNSIKKLNMPGKNKVNNLLDV